jgi:hypothetical protein
MQGSRHKQHNYMERCMLPGGGTSQASIDCGHNALFSNHPRPLSLPRDDMLVHMLIAAVKVSVLQIEVSLPEEVPTAVPISFQQMI